MPGVPLDCILSSYPQRCISCKNIHRLQTEIRCFILAPTGALFFAMHHHSSSNTSNRHAEEFSTFIKLYNIGLYSKQSRKGDIFLPILSRLRINSSYPQPQHSQVNSTKAFPSNHPPLCGQSPLPSQAPLHFDLPTLDARHNVWWRRVCRI